MAQQQIPQRLRDVVIPTLSAVGIIGATEAYVVGGTTAASPSQYWDGWLPSPYFQTNIQTAYDRCQGGRNEVVLVTPESHSRSAALTFNENMTHVVGMYGPAYQNQRSRIFHSATLSPLMTVSGQGSVFANLYFGYGLGNATDLNLLAVTGNRNTFKHCHFLAANATPLDESGFKLIDLQAAETYFDHCYFGGDTVAWSNGTMINFAASSEPPRVVFEDCMFVMNGDNSGTPTFLKTVAGLGRCTIVFKRCMFLNLGTTLTLAIDGAGLGNAKMIFDINCTFAGVTDIVAAAKESSVWVGHGGYTAASLLNNLIATHPDLS
jgi:hypothetical protein